MASPSWRAAINLQRRDIQRVLDKAPSLRRELQAETEHAYRYAAADAADEKLDTGFFPRGNRE